MRSRRSFIFPLLLVIFIQNMTSNNITMQQVQKGFCKKMPFNLSMASSIFFLFILLLKNKQKLPKSINFLAIKHLYCLPGFLTRYKACIMMMRNLVNFANIMEAYNNQGIQLFCYDKFQAMI